MTETEDTIARLDALEIRIVHQDSIIDELSEVSLKQWNEIKSLTDQLDHLTNKLQELENGINNPSDDDTPPPHF
ncbi:MAG: SlyX family protein [Alphaproteobacteria bacterium]